MKVSRFLPLLVIGAVALSGCSVLRGAPDREESFATSYGECTAQWWLEDLADDVPDDAQGAARTALEDAQVSEDERAEWESVLLDSQSEGAEIPEDRLEGQAHIEVVRAEVRAALDDAGYPDQDRIIEVWSDLNCSNS